MSDNDDIYVGESLIEQVLNRLAFTLLNPSLDIDQEYDLAESVDFLARQVRMGSLGIMLALMQVAQAIEKSKD